MFLFLNKEMKFVTNDTKDEFLGRIKRHTDYSAEKNFVFATTDDYAIKSKFLPDRVIVKSKYGRGSYKTIVRISSETPTKILVKVVPNAWVLIAPLLMAGFFILMLLPVFFVVGFLLLSYIATLIGYAFHLWWTKNLFETILLTK